MNTRKTALDFIKALCVHGITFHNVASSYAHHFSDEVRSRFILSNSVEKILEKTYNSHLDVRKIADDCVKALCVHGTMFKKLSSSDSHHLQDDIRNKFILASGVEKLVEKLDVSEERVWNAALDHVKALCVHGITFAKIPSSDFHHFPDDIRTRFIAANGVRQLVKKLDIWEWGLREAAHTGIRALCDHGTTFSIPLTSNSHRFPDDIRNKIVSTNGIEELIVRLSNSDRDTQQATLDFVKALCVQGITSYDIVSSDSHLFTDEVRTRFILGNNLGKLLERTYTTHWGMDSGALEDYVKAFAVHGTTFSKPPSLYSHYFQDDIRTKFISSYGVERIIEKLDVSEYKSAALYHVKVLCVYGITFCTVAFSDSHRFPDDIRTTFIRVNGVEKLIERLIGDLDHPGAPFRNAAVDCVKALCDHGI